MSTVRPSSKQVRKNIYTDIPQQFPGIYREEGPIFVDFVKSYYEYIDTRQNDFRDAFAIRDIDTTFERFLLYFKKKYLNALPLKGPDDTRFIVKHIQDLYRRKGSKESVELLFQMFFDNEIEVFYPSYYILRVSDSKYGSTRYLEMAPVLTIVDYPIRKGDRISGDTSKADAFVDELVFQTLDGLIVPILYLSNLNGAFTRDDNLRVRGARNGVEVDLYPGQDIFGSITSAPIERTNRSAGNKPGDKVIIRSNKSGINATAAVSEISEAETAVIDFDITDGGWGYSVAVIDNVIQTSTGTLAFQLFPGTYADTYTPQADRSGFPKVGDYFISDATLSAGTARFNSGGSGLSGATNFAYGQVVGIDQDNDLVFVNFPSANYSLITTDNTLYSKPLNNAEPFRYGFDGYFYDKGYLISGTDIASEFSLFVNDPSGGSFEPGLNLFFEEDINGRKRFDVTDTGTITIADYNAVNEFFNGELTDPTQRNWIRVNIEQYLIANIDKIVGLRGDLTGYWSAITAAEFINDSDPHVNPGTAYPKSGYITAVSPFNNTASYRIGEIADPETVSFIPDVIGDFVDVRLDSINYGMSGDLFETLDTTLAEAFKPVTYNIGTIKSLIITNNGQGYQSDVKSLITQTEVAKYDKRDVAVIFEDVRFSGYQSGDIFEQTIQVEQTQSGILEDYKVRARFLRRDGDIFYFRPITFYQFDKKFPIVYRGESYNVLSVARDDLSLPIGRNAVIDGAAEFARGQIKSLNILTTGFRYEDNELVDIIGDEKLLKTTDSNGAVVTIDNPNYGKTVATSHLEVLGTGTTEAGWLTTTSFLNDPTKVIPDNYYYQEYSFDIRSILAPETYTEIVTDVVQPAGTKQFGSSLINTTNYVNVDLDASMEIYDLSIQPLAQEIANTNVSTLGAVVANTVVGDLVAIIQTLDIDSSNTITQDIND